MSAGTDKTIRKLRTCSIVEETSGQTHHHHHHHRERRPAPRCFPRRASAFGRPAPRVYRCGAQRAVAGAAGAAVFALDFFPSYIYTVYHITRENRGKQVGAKIRGGRGDVTCGGRWQIYAVNYIPVIWRVGVCIEQERSWEGVPFQLRPEEELYGVLVAKRGTRT